MAASSLCRCICGTRRWDELNPAKGAGGFGLGADFDTLEEIDEAPFQPPAITGLLSYSVAVDQPLRGVPIREGELWYLSAEEQVEPVTFTLYVNGFMFLQNGREVSISLEPFALVRNCKFQSNYSNLNLSDFKIFKVSLFTQGICYYYGVRGVDERHAEEERSRWVLDISRAMRLVTQSLFPPFNISCDPVVNVAQTEKRLMAGYLIHHDDSYSASVLYCELHPQNEDQAKLVLYENELCRTQVMEVFLTDRSVCCEKVGINCSCFVVESHQFSSRTLSERKLWLRAISNVKVKLQNRAPPPAHEELTHYRAAIKDHIHSIKATLEGTVPMDALLQRQNRKSFAHSGHHHQDSLMSMFPEARVASVPTQAPECRIVQHHEQDQCGGPTNTILEHRSKSGDASSMALNGHLLAAVDAVPASVATSKDKEDPANAIPSEDCGAITTVVGAKALDGVTEASSVPPSTEAVVANVDTVPKSENGADNAALGHPHGVTPSGGLANGIGVADAGSHDVATGIAGGAPAA